MVDILAGDLFGGHVRRRTNDRTRHGAFGLGAINIGDARDTEVGQFHAALPVDHHVGRLDVAVNNAVLVSDFQCVEQLAHHAHGIGQRELAVDIKVRFEFLAADELHHDVGDIAFFTEVEHLHDVGVVHARDGLRLAHESCRVFFCGIRVERGGENGLDRDDAIEPRIAAFVDDAHRTLAENARDLEAAYAFDFLRCGGHFGISQSCAAGALKQP